MFTMGLLINVVNVEVVESEQSTEKWFDFDQDEELVTKIDNKKGKTILSEQIKDMGFETYNPILNIGGLFLAINFYFVLLVYAAFLVAALKFMDRLSPKLKESYKKPGLQI